MNAQRLLDRFLTHVQCASESRDERAYCELVEQELKALGFETARDRAAAEQCGSNGWNVYGHRPGRGEPLLFSAHLDTVQPGKGVRPVVADGKITSSGDTVLGADDKSGIVAVLEAVACVVEEGAEARPVEVYFTVCEEAGLLGSRHGDMSMIQATQAVVLDGGTPGTAVNRSPSHYKMKVRVKGKPAHAAVAPELGIHALKAAAQAVSEIELGRIDDDSVRNISNFLSPGATNVVAEHASFEAEIRSLRDELAQKHVEEVYAALERVCAQCGATYEIECTKEFDALHVPDDSPLLQLLRKCSAEQGREMVIEATMGGSDAVNFAARGIDAVNIGTGMTNAHGLDEFILVSDLENTADLVHRLITA